ncbi:MAG TPA: enoyl-ACP reductase FabV [Spirochaetia bacterium]|nr:enoyl-ACP reductase FabV [Spirochaetia bacterium]
MVVEPKFRNNIFMNAHPVGCAAEVENQIDYVRGKQSVEGPSRVLVIGGSTGYGLAARIVAGFGARAATVGIAFEKEGSEKRTGTAGWYNVLAFDKAAHAAGIISESINGDAFSQEIKAQAIEVIKKRLGKVDLIVYSLASPVRTDPASGETYRSVLKPIGRTYTKQSVDIMSGEIKEFTIEPATEEEINATRKVMGGEDWELWVDALLKAGVLAQGVKTVAFSYIGPEVTFPVYREGTVGKAKEHLEATAHSLSKKLAPIGGNAYVSVNKALVTRSSAVIPVVPLYISLLFKVMKERNLHEGCIEQMSRLFTERLYSKGEVPVDEEGRIRIDDLEMRPDVQKAVMELWGRVSNENFEEIADAEGYRKDFFKIHGFDVAGVDYSADVET